MSKKEKDLQRALEEAELTHEDLDDAAGGIGNELIGACDIACKAGCAPGCSVGGVNPAT